MVVLEMNGQRMLTIPEMAARAGMTPGRVRQLLYHGQLSGVKVSRKLWLIPESEFDKISTPARTGRPRKGSQQVPPR
jgi:excisionase family DNA binding protein